MTPVATAAMTPQLPAPSQPAPASPAAHVIHLPANTPITLSINAELSSRDGREGDTFPLTVVQDVLHEGHVVIARGTRAMGEVVWRTGRGPFGKSGKMEVAMRYLDMNGCRIPLEGVYRQEGEGNTGATIGAVIGAGVIGGLVVTGRSARIPSGRELPARTIDVIPFDVGPAGADGRPAVAFAATYVPSAVQTGRPESGERRQRREEREARRTRWPERRTSQTPVRLSLFARPDMEAANPRYPLCSCSLFRSSPPASPSPARQPGSGTETARSGAPKVLASVLQVSPPARSTARADRTSPAHRPARKRPATIWFG